MSRRKRTLLAVGLLVAVAALVVLGIASVPERPPIEFDRVRLGMTISEAGQAMGKNMLGHRMIMLEGENGGEIACEWMIVNPGKTGYVGHILTRFDTEGKIVAKDFKFAEPAPPPEPLLSRLRRWLGL